MLFKRQRIAAELEQLDRLPLTERESEKHEQAIIAEITALWQTDEVRRRQPTVRDEIRMGLDYYPSVLFETLPALYDELADNVLTIEITIPTNTPGAAYNFARLSRCVRRSNESRDQPFPPKSRCAL